MIEFSHFENDFGYLFEGEPYYKLFTKIDNIEPEIFTEINDYTDDKNNSIVTRTAPNEGITLIIPNVDYWFANMLNRVFSCSYIRFNGIDYTVDGEISVKQVEDQVYQANVEITLKNAQ